MIHTIWNSEVNVNDYKDFLQEEHPEAITEDEKYDLVNELNGDYLQDERANLSGIKGKILAIVDLGLWDGRRTGYRILPDISQLLYSEYDYAHWFVKGNTAMGEFTHHDGTNYVKYYLIRDGAENKPGFEDLISEIYDNRPISKSRLYRYTKSLGKEIRKIYGW